MISAIPGAKPAEFWQNIDQELEADLPKTGDHGGLGAKPPQAAGSFL